ALLHGWAMSPDVWTAVKENLRGREAYAPALPGYGAAPMCMPYDLDTVVQALSESAPAEVDVIGWSLGGLVALQWALEKPLQVRKLVLLGATPRFLAADGWPHGVAPAVWRIFVRELRQNPDALMRRFSALQAEGEEDSKGLTKRIYANRAQAAPDALQASLNVLAAGDVRERVRAVQQPVLLLHGERDAITPLAAARWLSETLPRAALQVYEGAG